MGIRGEEGVQAVNASDYAFAQFRYLAILLLRHGRYNYIRMSGLINYMFYKNVFMSITMYWFSFFAGLSGTKPYTEAAIQFFNLFYTSVPIILYGVYDRDLSLNACINHPQLYKAGIENQYFNVRVFGCCC